MVVKIMPKRDPYVGLKKLRSLNLATARLREVLVCLGRILDDLLQGVGVGFWLLVMGFSLFTLP